LAVTILGALLCEVQAKTPRQWREVYKKFEYYTDVNGHMPHDYERDSETIFAAIQLSLKHEQTGNGHVGMENVLQALALFGRRLFDEPPINLVKLAWSYLQPLQENCYFDDLLRCLVKRNLVKESWGHYDSRSQQVSWNH
jgi:hypothetical protein